LINGDKLRGDAYVFACGPWLPKVFPDLLGNKFRLPLGQVVYYGTPPSSDRFTYPNMPSFNFPGVTGWVALPEDSRGFRVRGTESGPRPAPAATDSTGRGGRGAAAAGSTPPAASARSAGTGDSEGRGGQRGAAPGDSTGRGGGAGANRPPADPAQQDPDLSTRWFDIATQARQREFVNHRFPGMKDAPVLATHACHYELTSSRNFIIDQHPEMSNVWIAGGGNSEAYKSGPVIGEYVAHRVTGVLGDPAIAAQFRIPKDGYPAPGTPADTAGRGGRGQPIPARSGGDFDDDEEY
jgi:glycine/D-amino acid oxidase-like deaminating enzyme